MSPYIVFNYPAQLVRRNEERSPPQLLAYLNLFPPASCECGIVFTAVQLHIQRGKEREREREKYGWGERDIDIG